MQVRNQIYVVTQQVLHSWSTNFLPKGLKYILSHPQDFQYLFGKKFRVNLKPPLEGLYWFLIISFTIMHNSVSGILPLKRRLLPLMILVTKLNQYYLVKVWFFSYYK